MAARGSGRLGRGSSDDEDEVSDGGGTRPGTAVENYQRMFGLEIVQERLSNPITGAFDMVGLGYTDEVFIFLASPVQDDSAMRRLMRTARTR